MADTRPVRPTDIVLRKAGDPAADSTRKKLVDFLKSSAIITDKCTGMLVLTFQDGGLRSSKLELIDPV